VGFRWCRVQALHGITGVLGLGDPGGENGQAVPWAESGSLLPGVMVLAGGGSDDSEWLAKA